MKSEVNIAKPRKKPMPNLDCIEQYNFPFQLQNSVLEWLQYKEEKKQSYKPTGLKVLLNKIQKSVAEHGEKLTIECIEKSMVNNYSGIFFENINKTNSFATSNNLKTIPNYETGDKDGISL